MADKNIAEAETTISLLNLVFDTGKHEIVLHANAWLLLCAAAIFLVALFILRGRIGRWTRSMEFDEAVIGIGSGKMKLRPNNTDRQVAYQVWVELSTRKIGLEIDLEHDVVSEIYDSWHTFFGVTRDLIKSVPVTKVTDKSTQKIINMSIAVLNEGLRPHLTRWQARFRGWFQHQMDQAERKGLEPQLVQRDFPAFAELQADLLQVNARLIAYRAAMRALVYGEAGGQTPSMKLS
ncbi:hypothetical protein [Sphingobium sp. SA916]|uniref:hypothetical protein n=1 Tax=Sphingobium sp. SA916 TaxID=1851207 RepID=UPI000CC4C6D4|nr:hypothetical protein [Sphingobium sp. SA916]PNP99320.1 hypothetical protein A8G00_19865 [Sphingobium sp. SA916]